MKQNFWTNHLTHFAGLLLWVLLLWGAQYALRDFWEADEARFVYVAREMRATGQWLVPHRHGEIYSDKPPLMMWLINLGEATLGDISTNFAARLPCLLGVLLALWAVRALGIMLGGVAVGWRAVAVLSTTWLFWQVGGRGQIDALLTGLELAAFALLLLYDHHGGRWRVWLAFFLMGLAILAKGPVGLLIPLGSYLIFTLAGGQRSKLHPSQWWGGLALALSLPFLWLLACKVSGAPQSYFHELLFTQNFSRAAGKLGHRQPWLYFLYATPVAMLPWLFFVPVAWQEVQKKNRRFLWQLVGWFFFVLLFFSLSASKRHIYILSALAAPALLLAKGWQAIEASPFCRRLAETILSLAAVTALLGMLVCILDHQPPFAHWGELLAQRELDLSPWVFLLLATAPAGGAIWLYARKEGKWLLPFALGLAATFALVGAILLPAHNRMKTPQEIIPLAERYIPPNGHLLLYKMRGEIMALYAGRRGLHCDDDEELQDAMDNEGCGMAIFPTVYGDNFEERFSNIIAEGGFHMGKKTLRWFAFQSATNREQ